VVNTVGAETIDGSATKTIANRYDALRVVYLDAASEYVVI